MHKRYAERKGEKEMKLYAKYYIITTIGLICSFIFNSFYFVIPTGISFGLGFISTFKEEKK